MIDFKSAVTVTRPDGSKAMFTIPRDDPVRAQEIIDRIAPQFPADAVWSHQPTNHKQGEQGAITNGSNDGAGGNVERDDPGTRPTGAPTRRPFRAKRPA